MARLTVHTQETAPTGAKPYLEKIHEMMGMVPNVFGVFSNAPVALQCYQELNQINAKTQFSPVEIEVIQITTAAYNQCQFCLAAHSVMAKQKLAFDDDFLTALQTGNPVDHKKYAALQAFTRAILENKGNVSDQELANFFAAGYTQQHVLEVFVGVSLATLTNYVNNLAHPEINPEWTEFAANLPETDPSAPKAYYL